ncbi:hypothetical protein J2797_003075 [Paraburkholderia terricola]|uniref:hypothetical protein n=1 Tax=Paraburkholderia terricola TaxID=169427 RepID=UPI002861A8BD|nr:hypothetical protein [Paraburkholderia terricola]MDR6493179.1 hypothetical protein [Paraburkholderia terricola]
MPPSHLEKALTSVDWNANAKLFLADGARVTAVEQANLRVAVWAKQFEAADQGNPALSFIREMQSAGHVAAACISLALYKAAAGSIRNMAENALYYTYFRSHPKELITLVRNSKYFIDKNEILDFHKLHTADFTAAQQQASLIGDLETWYSLVSSIVHGQLPGIWSGKGMLAATAHDEAVKAASVKVFCEGETLVHRLFLCTSGRELWEYFSQTAKTKLIAGLDGKLKTVLGLDSH